MWSINADDMTVLTGMPSGTWYVKVYDGFTEGSTIGSVGVGNTIDGVPNGSRVDIEINTPFGLTTLQPAVPTGTWFGFTRVR